MNLDTADVVRLAARVHVDAVLDRPRVHLPGGDRGGGDPADDSAPAALPIRCSAAACRIGSPVPSATTSLTPNRPLGRGTRKASAGTAALSPDRLITQVEMTTSTERGGRGMASIVPCRNSTFATPACSALRRAPGRPARSSQPVTPMPPSANVRGPQSRAGSHSSWPSLSTIELIENHRFS
nr:hypothetical protein [Nonomuraea typhae]